MAEIPVIVSNLPEMKHLVETNQVGIVAPENSPVGLQQAIQKIVTMDQNAFKKNIKTAKLIYNWEQQEKVLLKVYSEL